MSSTLPLVSIVCTCFNQREFIADSINSVLNQSYKPIELIIIDDCSLDGSQDIISTTIEGHPQVVFISNKQNQGICKNFNNGLKQSKGKYLIDLSGDDILLLDRIEKQVAFFEILSQKYGVIYSNAEMIDENEQSLGHYYPTDKENKSQVLPYQESIYSQLIKTCFIAAPTMMMMRSMLGELGGYDENLAYEDFDFWIRSSRKWKYAYQDEVLTKIRKTPGSLSSSQYHHEDDQLLSTYKVCEKIKALNQTKEEDQALIKRLKYEIRHAVFAEKRHEAKLFLGLLNELQPLSFSDKLFRVLHNVGAKTAWLRNTYLKIKNR